jgi:hypothetical protein
VDGICRMLLPSTMVMGMSGRSSNAIGIGGGETPGGANGKEAGGGGGGNVGEDKRFASTDSIDLLRF